MKKKFLGISATKFVAYTAVMTALTYVGTLLGFSSAQFYFNLGDTVILLCAALFGPISAMIAGGLGAFLGDLTVYPVTMLFTLIIKAIEGLLAGLLFMGVNYIIKRIFGKSDIQQPGSDGAVDEPSADKTDADESFASSRNDKRRKTVNLVVKILLSLVACIIPTGIMMVGYFICQTFFYGTYAAALLALPMDAMQAAISSVLAVASLYILKLERFKDRLISG